MTKVIVIALVLIVLCSLYGLFFGINSWSDEQAWYLLGFVYLILCGWSLGTYISRNEGPRKG